MKNIKKIWIIGGSSGIGLELSKLFLKNGNQVIISSRNAEKNSSLLELKEKYLENVELINIDITTEIESEIINRVWNSFNGLDLWFYNAGAYEVMSIDSWNINNFKILNETNYMGAVKVMIELLPYFKKQKYGKWVWNLSLSSYFGLPKGGAYSAPKAALLNLAQSIHPELKRYDIDLQVINHGFVKTRLTKKNDFEMPQLMEPKYAAGKIYNEIENDNFEIRFPFKLAQFLNLLSMLPYKISLFMTKKMLK